MSLAMRSLFELNAIHTKITIMEFSSFFACQVTRLLFTFLDVFVIFITPHAVMTLIAILSLVFSHVY
jgi:hypothetical protein